MSSGSDSDAAIPFDLPGNNAVVDVDAPAPPLSRKDARKALEQRLRATADAASTVTRSKSAPAGRQREPPVELRTDVVSAFVRGTNRRSWTYLGLEPAKLEHGGHLRCMAKRFQYLSTDAAAEEDLWTTTDCHVLFDTADVGGITSGAVKHFKTHGFGADHSVVANAPRHAPGQRTILVDIAAAKVVSDERAAAAAPAVAPEARRQRAVEKFLTWMCAKFVPFSTVEDPEFVALWEELSSFPIPRGLQCGESVRNRIVSEAAARLKVAAQFFANKQVTLAIDSGTVWKRYLTVVVLSPGMKPLVASMIVDERLGVGTRDAGHLTAKNIAHHLRELMQGLLFSADVVAIVADNAANMQAAIHIAIERQDAEQNLAGLMQNLEVEGGDLVPGEARDILLDAEFGDGAPAVLADDSPNDGRIMPQRCFCHAVQLVVADLLKGPFKALYDEYEEVKHHSKVKDVETRWNSVYATVNDLVGDPEGTLKGRLPKLNDPPLVQRLTLLKKYLKPFYDATMDTQGDKNTVWDALVAMDKMLRAFEDNSDMSEAYRAAIRARAGVLISPPMFLLAWFAPNLPRALLTDEEKQVAAAHHAVAIGREDMAYATLFATARRPVNEQPISLRQLLEHFALRDRATFSDHLAVRRADAQERLVRRLVRIAPTEAAVERVFSALKLNVGRLRTRCKPDAAVAQVLFKTTTTFLAEASKQSLLAPEDCTTVLPQTMLSIVRLGAAKLRVSKPHQAAAIEDHCAVCRTKHPRTDTRAEQYGALFGKWLRCDRCKLWYGAVCLGMSMAEFQAVENGPGDFLCNVGACAEPAPEAAAAAARPAGGNAGHRRARE
jgi:hypothetical protein